MSRLDEIRARVEKATKGPWLSVRSVSVEVDDGRGSAFAVANQHDMNFIATSRADVPWLVSEVERLKGLVKQAEYADRNTDDSCPWCGSIEIGQRWSHEKDFGAHTDTCPAFHQNGDVR